MSSASSRLLWLGLASSLAACTSLLGDDFQITGSAAGAGGATATTATTGGGSNVSSGGGATTTSSAGGAGGATSSSTTTASGGGGGGTGGAGPVCTTDVADPVPLTMTWVLDATGSVSLATWDMIATALQNFAESPGWPAMRVGANHYPGGSGGMCNPDSYDPLAFPFSDIVANPDPLTNYLATVSPQGQANTPSPLGGTLGVAVAEATANADQRVVNVLFFDGPPTSCGGTSDMVDAANQGFTENVPTYTIALAAFGLGEFQMVASAGGGMQFEAIGANGIEGALAAIRDDALNCAHLNTSGITVAANLEVRLNTTPPTTVPPVSGEADCTGPGWYFGGGGDRILLCPASCQIITDAPSTQMGLIHSCQ